MIASLSFIVYIAMSLELVFGEYGIANNENLYHAAIYQDLATEQEYQNISELPNERSETIQKSFSIPKALAISGSILAIPILGYTVYHRRNQKKQKIALDKAEIKEETNEVICNSNEDEAQEPALDQSQTIEETSEANCKQGRSTQDLNILRKCPIGMPIPRTFDLKLMANEPMMWKADIDLEMEYAYLERQTNLHQVQKLDSRIWAEDNSDIYSPKVHKEFKWLLESPGHLGLPPCRRSFNYNDEPLVPINYVLILGDNKEYLDIFKPVYEPKLNDAKSENIDDMIDKLLENEEKAVVGKIKTNLPVGLVIRAKMISLAWDCEKTLYVCSHYFDPITGETTVSLAYRYTFQIRDIRKPLNAESFVPADILRRTLNTLGYISLNTLPEQKDRADQSLELGTSVTDLAIGDITVSPVGEDTVDESACVDSNLCKATPDN